MKKMLVLLLSVMVMTALAACGVKSESGTAGKEEADVSKGETQDTPEEEMLRADLEEYISKMGKEGSEITDFSVDRTDVEGDRFTAYCITTYQDKTTKYEEEFELIYEMKDNSWDKNEISVVGGYEGRSRTALDGSDTSDTDDEQETSEEVPAYLADYKAPSELGSDPVSGNVEIEGKVYTLPAPLTEFTEDGWKIIDKTTDFVETGSTNFTFVNMEKGDARIFAGVKNYALYQTLPENCAVYKVEVSQDEYTALLTLPGGVMIGSTKADVDAWLPKGVSCDEGNEDDTDYCYSTDLDADTDTVLSILVDKKTDTVNSITVENDIWNW